MTRTIEITPERSVTVEEFHDLQDEAGAVVWDAALVLAYYLTHCHEVGKCLVQGKTVVELGAGPGLVGLTAAALGASKVVITDLPHLLPYVQQNIEANKEVAANAVGLPLTWGNNQDISQVLEQLNSGACSTSGQHPLGTQQPADGEATLVTSGTKAEKTESESAVTSGGNGSAPSKAATAPTSHHSITPSHTKAANVVLASDVIYQADQLHNLFGTIFQLCNDDTRMLLSYENRPGMGIFHAVASCYGLDIEEVEMASLHPDWQSPDIHVFVLRLKD